MIRFLLPFAIFILAACDGDGFNQPRLPVNDPSQAVAWEVGPILDGVSKSINVPARPYPVADGLAIDVPYPNASAGHVHYVTFNAGSLVGKTQLTLRYRIEAGDGVELRAASPDDGHARPAMLTLYFQRCGDDWMAMPPRIRTGDEGTEAHRWWAAFATVAPLTAGEGVVSVDLADPRWTATQTSSAASNPTGFQKAMEDTCRVGFTLGGGDGYGHGIFATGPARFIIQEFTVS